MPHTLSGSDPLVGSNRAACQSAADETLSPGCAVTVIASPRPAVKLLHRTFGLTPGLWGRFRHWPHRGRRKRVFQLDRLLRLGDTLPDEQRDKCLSCPRIARKPSSRLPPELAGFSVAEDVTSGDREVRTLQRHRQNPLIHCDECWGSTVEHAQLR